MTLSEADSLPHGQPKAVINRALPVADGLSGLVPALIEEEVIRVL